MKPDSRIASGRKQRWTYQFRADAKEGNVRDGATCTANGNVHNTKVPGLVLETFLDRTVDAAHWRLSECGYKYIISDIEYSKLYQPLLPHLLM